MRSARNCFEKPNVAEIIQEQVNGFIVNDGNPLLCKEKVKLLLNNPEL
jgi:hypothetical protein